MLAEGKTQQQVADEMNTSKQRIFQFATLEKIDNAAWKLVSTTISNCVDIDDEGLVVKKSTTVDITEGLLRHILDLTEYHQLRIIQELIDGKSQEAIAEVMEVDQGFILKLIDNMKNRQMSKFHETFKPIIYSVWNQAKQDNDRSRNVMDGKQSAWKEEYYRSAENLSVGEIVQDGTEDSRGR
ncbi:MAG: hypothetical protein HQK62_07490 [Desulfamplus sp.]|nr:hypothetical protein [Desulfamplus sp.]